MILGNLSSNIKSHLRILRLSRPQFNIHCECDGDCNCAPDCNENTGALEELLFSSCSLQHLVMTDVLLTPKMAKSICKNGKTLEILNLNFSNLSDLGKPILKEIIPSCQELKEVDLAYVNYGEGIENADFEFLAKNITPNVEKLNLSSIWSSSISQDPEFNDYCFEILLRRCNKIKSRSHIHN